MKSTKHEIRSTKQYRNLSDDSQDSNVQMTKISMSDNETLLSVENLSTHFLTEEGTVKAVQDVGFSIKKGRTFGLVGESGCGKSVTALSIMRLVPAPQGKSSAVKLFSRERTYWH